MSALRLIECSRWLLLASAVALFAGCSSYRVCGFVPRRVGAAARPPSERFRISSLRVLFETSVSDDRYVFPYAAKCPASTLIAKISSLRPDVFSEDPSAREISVDVVMRWSRVGGRASFLVYLFSLCTLPVWEDLYSAGDVRVFAVGPDGERKNLSTAPVRFESNNKFTFYSPIGWIPYADRPDAAVIQKGSGPYSPPQDELRTVFVRTVADAAAGALAKIPAVPLPDRAHRRCPPANSGLSRTSDARQPSPSLPDKAEPRPDFSKGLPTSQDPSCPVCGAKLAPNEKCPLCDN